MNEINLREINENAERLVLILNDYKLLYAPIPKVACTKLRTLLILLNRGSEDSQLYEFIQKAQASFLHWEFGISDNYQMTGLELNKIFKDPNYFKFAFVRNPYKRIESMYHYRIGNPGGQINLFPPSYAIYIQKYSLEVAKKIKAEIIWDAPDTIKKIHRNLNVQVKGLYLLFRKLSFSLQVRYGRDFKAETLGERDYDILAKKIVEYHKKTYDPESFDRIYTQISQTIQSILEYPKLEDINLEETPISFEEFINFICEQPVNCMDRHWMPQTLILDHDKTEYNFIGCIENFEEDLISLFDKIQAPKYMYQYIKGKENRSQRIGHASLWKDDLAQKFYEKYKSDFEAFNYDKMSYKK